MARKLPAALRSLVHHVKLNETGWWDEAARSVVVAAMWLLGEPASAREICDSVRTDFGIQIELAAIEEVLRQLVALERIVERREDEYQLRQTEIARLETDLESCQETEALAKEFFEEQYAEVFGDDPVSAAWSEFNSRVLLPLVAHYGAETYDIVTARNLSSQEPLPDQLLSAYAEDEREDVRHVAAGFLDPKNPNVRAYVLGLLTSYFMVEACGLSEETLDGLRELGHGRVEFSLLLDTNFVVSAFGLNEEPANEAAAAVLRLIASEDLQRRVDVRLRILPLTYTEVRHLLEGTAAGLRGVAISRSVAEGIRGARVSSIVRSYIEVALHSRERLSAQDYFRPYIDGLTATLASLGIEVQRDQRLDGYPMQEFVIDEVEELLAREESLPPYKRKNRSTLEHDVILWTYALDKRPSVVESPADAKFWVLTQDYRLINYDRRMYQQQGASLPICVHPTRITQLLAFWVPRSDQVDEILLSALRLPLASETLDLSSEDAALSIIQMLSRFEDADDMPPEVVSAVLRSQSLLDRLEGSQNEEEQAEFIREAVNEESRQWIREQEERVAKAQAVIDDREQRICELEELRKADEVENTAKGAEIDERTATVATLTEQIRQQKEKIAQQERDISEQAAMVTRQEERLAEQDRLGDETQTKVATLESAWRAERSANRRRGFVWLRLVLPMAVTVIASICVGRAARVCGLTTDWDWRLFAVVFALGATGVVWLARRSGSHVEEFDNWPFFRGFSKAVAWITAAFAAVFLSAVGTMVYETLAPFFRAAGPPR